jgi:hypothetical protein
MHKSGRRARMRMNHQHYKWCIVYRCDYAHGGVHGRHGVGGLPFPLFRITVFY